MSYACNLVAPVGRWWWSFGINFKGDELVGCAVRVGEGGGADLMWGGVGNIGSATSMFNVVQNIVQHCSKHCSTLFETLFNFVQHRTKLCSTLFTTLLTINWTLFNIIQYESRPGYLQHNPLWSAQKGRDFMKLVSLRTSRSLITQMRCKSCGKRVEVMKAEDREGDQGNEGELR